MTNGLHRRSACVGYPYNAVGKFGREQVWAGAAASSDSCGNAGRRGCACWEQLSKQQVIAFAGGGVQSSQEGGECSRNAYGCSSFGYLIACSRHQRIAYSRLESGCVVCGCSTPSTLRARIQRLGTGCAHWSSQVRLLLIVRLLLMGLPVLTTCLACVHVCVLCQRPRRCRRQSS